MWTRVKAAVVVLAAAAGLVISLLALADWNRATDRLELTDATPVEAPPPAQARPVEPGRKVPRADAGPDRMELRDGPVPTMLGIPSVGLSMPVRPVGVTPDLQMQLPDDPRILGWYRFGPAPGATGSTGSAVLAGHLDSERFGVGPLVRLRDVQVGERIDVRLVGGERREYAVTTVERFDRFQIPDALFARTGPALLRVITCGGDYDPSRGYEQNVVVTARPLPRPSP